MICFNSCSPCALFQTMVTTSKRAGRFISFFDLRNAVAARDSFLCFVCEIVSAGWPCLIPDRVLTSTKTILWWSLTIRSISPNRFLTFFARKDIPCFFRYSQAMRSPFCPRDSCVPRLKRRSESVRFMTSAKSIIRYPNQMLSRKMVTTTDRQTRQPASKQYKTTLVLNLPLPTAIDPSREPGLLQCYYFARRSFRRVALPTRSRR